MFTVMVNSACVCVCLCMYSISLCENRLRLDPLSEDSFSGPRVLKRDQTWF